MITRTAAFEPLVWLLSKDRGSAEHFVNYDDLGDLK